MDVDLGVKNIASDSMGETFSGDKLNGIRHQYFRLRRKLQKKGTKSSTSGAGQLSTLPNAVIFDELQAHRF